MSTLVSRLRFWTGRVFTSFVLCFLHCWYVSDQSMPHISSFSTAFIRLEVENTGETSLDIGFTVLIGWGEPVKHQLRVNFGSSM